MTTRQSKRFCGFCRATARMTIDTDSERQYTCNDCGATEKIVKSSNAGWWYAGWTATDGQKLRAPTTQEMSAGKFGWQSEVGQ